MSDGEEMLGSANRNPPKIVIDPHSVHLGLMPDDVLLSVLPHSGGAQRGAQYRASLHTRIGNKGIELGILITYSTCSIYKP